MLDLDLDFVVALTVIEKVQLDSGLVSFNAQFTPNSRYLILFSCRIMAYLEFGVNCAFRILSSRRIEYENDSVVFFLLFSNKQF